MRDTRALNSVDDGFSTYVIRFMRSTKQPLAFSMLADGLFRAADASVGERSMEKPHRIQRKAAKGWRLPPNSV